MSLETIFMADVIGSRKRDAAGQSALAASLAGFTAQLNTAHRIKIRSPLTVTLGDEFQGVVFNLKAAMSLLFAAEELRLETAASFQLRYVIYEGEIDTPVNPEHAHGMLGCGLTAARAALAEKGRGRPHISVHLNDGRLATALNSIFRVLWTLLEDWRAKDYLLIADMISFSNACIAEKRRIHPSQILRRRRTLRITDYIDLREAVLNLATRPYAREAVRELTCAARKSQGELSLATQMSQQTLVLDGVQRYERVREMERFLGLEDPPPTAIK